MKICQNCKVEYDDVENFCVRCGKKLASEGVTVEAMNDRLKRMEESLSRLSKGQPQPAAKEARPDIEPDVRAGLMEKINHNADVIERLSERLKELDGMTANDRDKARESVRRMITEESKNAGSTAVLDLRKELQNINSKLAALSEEMGKLNRDVDELHKGAESMETRVAKKIYNELTKSLIT